MLTIKNIEKEFDEKFPIQISGNHKSLFREPFFETEVNPEEVKAFIIQKMKDLALELAGEEDTEHWSKGIAVNKAGKHKCGIECRTKTWNELRQEILEHPILKGK